MLLVAANEDAVKEALNERAKQFFPPQKLSEGHFTYTEIRDFLIKVVIANISIIYSETFFPYCFLVCSIALPSRFKVRC